MIQKKKKKEEENGRDILMTFINPAGNIRKEKRNSKALIVRDVAKSVKLVKSLVGNKQLKRTLE